MVIYSKFSKRFAILGFWLMLFPCLSQAQILEHYLTDVTSSSFAVVFMDDAGVTQPSLTIYSDANANIDITANATITVLSDQALHVNGLAKIQVTGLEPGKEYFFLLSSDVAQQTYPVTSPYPTVRLPTQWLPAETTPFVVNDLIKIVPFKPTSITSLEHSILLVAIPKAISPYPISAILDSTGTAYVDGNNFLSTTGAQVSLNTLPNLEVTLLRGLLCPNALAHRQVSYRKMAGTLATDQFVSVDQPSSCIAGDVVCDDQINILDAQFTLNALNSSPSDCVYSDQLDVVNDQVINILDVQYILNLFN